MRGSQRRTLNCAMVSLLGLLPATAVSAQTRPAPDAFAAIGWLVGRWEGPSRGEPGQGTVSRTYDRVLGGRFIAVANTSRWAPLPSTPTGEVHEDQGFMSFDRARRRYVYRQFHAEGFVNTYVADSVSPRDTVVRLVSEQIENIAPGWRARETYTRTGTDSFVERFELAAPGKEFELYSESHLHRVRPEAPATRWPTRHSACPTPGGHGVRARNPAAGTAGT